MNTNFDHRSKDGFTLIELLVVMAIIGILVAIGVPTFSKARRNALQMNCASNLRQIGIAVKMYLMDHNNVFPPYEPLDSDQLEFGKVATNYLPYLNNATAVFRCPAQRNYLPGIYVNGDRFVIPGLGNSNAWVSYEFNSFFTHSTNDSRTLTSLHVTNASICAYAYDYPFDPDKPGDVPYLPHTDGINVLYCDWHVSWLPQDEYKVGGIGFWEKGHRP